VEKSIIIYRNFLAPARCQFRAKGGWAARLLPNGQELEEFLNVGGSPHTGTEPRTSPWNYRGHSRTGGPGLQIPAPVMAAGVYKTELSNKVARVPHHRVLFTD